MTLALGVGREGEYLTFGVQDDEEEVTGVFSSACLLQEPWGDEVREE